MHCNPTASAAMDMRDLFPPFPANGNDVQELAVVMMVSRVEVEVEFAFHFKKACH